MKQQLQALLRLVAIIRKVLVSRTSTIDNAKAAELELAHLARARPSRHRRYQGLNRKRSRGGSLGDRSLAHLQVWEYKSVRIKPLIWKGELQIVLHLDLNLDIHEHSFCCVLLSNRLLG